VEEAARRQQDKGDCFTLPSDLWVPLSRRLVETLHNTGWCVFGKNGSDVTSYAITAARIHTGKRVILCARGAYHGWHFWCQEHGQGIPEAWQSHVAHFEYNDVEDLERAVEENRDDTAAIMLTPHRHDTFRDQELPSERFVRAVNHLAGKHGFLVAMDDVRCGFRIRLEGSARHYGFDADLQCFGKAMGNGYPIAVCLGKEALRGAAEKVFFSGTHFFSGVPFAASLATLDEIEASDVIGRIRSLGERLMGRLESAAEDESVDVTLTGPPAMPFMTFRGDPGFEKSRFFCGEAARRGIFFHPHHNWFVSAALKEQELDKATEVARTCFALTKAHFDH
jgi:glutamate-1-semialdehyde 2,1-aminomutase